MINTPIVTLITKTRTQNQGNQALSVAWRDYLENRFPSASIRLLERSPTYLKQYSLQYFGSAKDPLAKLDEIATKLSKLPQGPQSIDPSTYDVVHTPNQEQVVRFLRLRKLLALRKHFARLGLGRSEYANRLAFLRKSKLVVVNPAGEFYPGAQETPLQYLIETRIAQLANIPTAFVNVSFEVDDPLVKKLSIHVFNNCDILEFRDFESQQRYRANGGVNASTVLPDGVLLHEIDSETSKENRGIALAINGLQLYHHKLGKEWDLLVTRIAKAHPLTLTSNEWTTDYAFWRRYLDYHNISCIGRDLDYREYGLLLGGFDLVISSRLHTCILGLVAGAAVLPVETGTFKLTGFYKEIGMDHEPIRMEKGSDWQERIMNRIEFISRNRQEQVDKQNEKVGKARTKLRSGLDHLFNGEILV